MPSTISINDAYVLIGLVFTTVALAVVAYKFWKGQAKIKEIKEACETAVNANKELLPLVDDKRLKLALEVKIAALQVVIALIKGGVIADNFGWELDEKVKALALWRDKLEEPSS